MADEPVVAGVKSDAIAVEALTHIDIDDIVALYRSVAWTVYADDPAGLEAALLGSTRVVTARKGDRLVGLARVISDGASICYLQDVLVHPDAQRQGVGRSLVEAVLEPFGAVRQKVLLTDDEPAQRAFYESLGYHETRDYGPGTLRAFVQFDR
jgi:GNAT superfamily N-acetyltransferase